MSPLQDKRRTTRKDRATQPIDAGRLRSAIEASGQRWEDMQKFTSTWTIPALPVGRTSRPGMPFQFIIQDIMDKRSNLLGLWVENFPNKIVNKYILAFCIEHWKFTFSLNLPLTLQKNLTSCWDGKDKSEKWNRGGTKFFTRFHKFFS